MGEGWKASLPLELQAQIDDLRSAGCAPGRRHRCAGNGRHGSAVCDHAAGLLDLFTAAEGNLKAARCEEFYEQQMSPNFRRTTAAKARRTLVTSCETRPEIRDRLLAAMQFAREGDPRHEYAGTRLVYDLKDKGLPFRQFVVEQVDKRWYIAE